MRLKFIHYKGSYQITSHILNFFRTYRRSSTAEPKFNPSMMRVHFEGKQTKVSKRSALFRPTANRDTDCALCLNVGLTSALISNSLGYYFSTHLYQYNNLLASFIWAPKARKSACVFASLRQVWCLSNILRHIRIDFCSKLVLELDSYLQAPE